MHLLGMVVDYNGKTPERVRARIHHTKGSLVIIILHGIGHPVMAHKVKISISPLILTLSSPQTPTTPTPSTHNLTFNVLKIRNGPYPRSAGVRHPWSSPGIRRTDP